MTVDGNIVINVVIVIVVSKSTIKVCTKYMTLSTRVHSQISNNSDRYILYKLFDTTKAKARTEPNNAPVCEAIPDHRYAC